MSKHVVIGLLVVLAGASAVVGGSLLLAADPPKEGAGLGLVFGGVVVDFIGLYIATTSARRNGARGNGGNVPSTLSNFLS
jgi:hypothetical protein